MAEEQKWEKVLDFLKPKPIPYCPHEPHLKQQVFLRTETLEALYGGRAGGGKMLRVFSEILSNRGWTTVGDLVVGDYVFDHDGTPTRVVAKSEVTTERTFEVRMADGEVIIAGENHLWNIANERQRINYQNTDLSRQSRRRSNRASSTQTPEEIVAKADAKGNGKGLTVGNNESAIDSNSSRAATTRETRERPSIWDYTTVMTTLEALELSKKERKRIAIPNAAPLHTDGEWLSEVPPYTFGAWLGDRGTGTGFMYVAESDREAFVAELEADGWEVRIKHTCTAPHRNQPFCTLELSRDGKTLGKMLADEGIGVKHVPSWVWNAPHADRQALIGGFCDTDGYVDESRGRIEFSFAVEELVHDMHSLFWSIGLTPTKVTHRSTENQTFDFVGEAWGFQVSQCSEYIFRLPRKRDSLRKANERNKVNHTEYRQIDEIVEIEPALMQCIQVDNPRGLFRIGRSFLTTHNSDALLMGALQHINIPGYAALLFRNTFADLSLPGALMDRAIEWFSDYPEIRFDRKLNTFHFPSGATITFGYLQGPDDHLRYKGSEVQYCVEKRTRVLMADGSWKAIEDIVVGEKVETLQGPREVLRTHDTGTKSAWRVTTSNGTSVLVSSTHRMLTSNFSWMDPISLIAKSDPVIDTTSSGSPASHPDGHTPSTDSREGLVTSQPAALEFRVEEGHQDSASCSIDGQTDCEVSGGGHTEALQPPVSSVLLALHGPAALSSSPSHVNRETCSHADVLKHDLPRRPTLGCSPDCLACSYCDDEHVRAVPEAAQDVPPSQADAGELAQSCCILDDQGNTQLCDPTSPVTYVHPYTLEICTALCQDVYSDVCEIRPAGEVETRDLTIDSSSHYIIEGGIVSANCGFDELTEIRESHYRYLLTRLRKPHPNTGNPLAFVPLRARSASNPAPNWVRRYFIEEGKANGRIYVPAGYDDNPFIDQKSYEEALERAETVDYLRLAKGDWYAEASGNYFDRDDFDIISPEDLPDNYFMNIVRYWDLAASEVSKSNRDPDYSVGLKAALVDGIFYIIDVRRFREGPARTEALVRQTALEDGPAVKIRMDKDPGQAGKAMISHYSRNVLLGFDFDGNPTTQSKVVRSGPWMAKVKRGEVKLVRGDWITAFIDEAVVFGSSKDAHDDQCDAAAGAFEVLSGITGKQRKRVEIIV